MEFQEASLRSPVQGMPLPLLVGGPALGAGEELLVLLSLSLELEASSLLVLELSESLLSVVVAEMAEEEPQTWQGGQMDAYLHRRPAIVDSRQ